MLNKLYKMVTPWATSSTYQIQKNRIIGRLANYIYPIYCKMVPIKRYIKENTKEPKTIVSLTSFPARIGSINLCLNSLLRQNQPADLVILWLARSQFPNNDDIPSKVRKLESAGLQIRFCDDIKSYKKVFFTAQKYPDATIITADDDTLYPENWLEGLLNKAKIYPDSVICYRAHKITVKNNEMCSYENWISQSPGESGPDKLLVPIGVGGVLYPAGFFRNIDFDIEVIRMLCPTADDLWLKVIGLKKGYLTVKVDRYSKEWFTIKSSQKEALMNANISENKNDIAMHNLLDYYGVDLSH